MTRDEAVSLATELINRDQAKDERYTVLEAQAIRKPYGWVLFYQSEAFVRTGKGEYLLAGNGPLVILDSDRSVHFLPSNASAEETVRKFEEGRGL